jgi:hypothetical protein
MAGIDGGDARVVDAPREVHAPEAVDVRLRGLASRRRHGIVRLLSIAWIGTVIYGIALFAAILAAA